MPLPLHEIALHVLPNLTADNYRITSDTSWQYNCIAWALGIADAWWWPVPGRYWPPHVPREETLAAFLASFATRGFTPCVTADLELGLEKIALYALGAVPTHAARQLSNGAWTSKLGPSFDIEHADLRALAGGVYGEPVAYLCREIAG
jgi:hypothetical protein